MTTLDAQIEAEAKIDFTLRKTKFGDRFKGQFSTRQLTVVQRMLEEDASGFECGMNARKYISTTKTSKAIATRDMQQLLEIVAFVLQKKRGA